MTFEEFQATGRVVADLSTVPEIAAQIDTVGPGRVYVDGLFIAGVPHAYCITIGDDSRITSLEEAERLLYEFAQSEGYV